MALSAPAQAGILVVQTVFHLYLLAVLLRFLLQVARADFYNPITQFVVKATNPPLKPLRRVIPGLAGLDIASLVLALLIQCGAIWLSGLIAGLGFLNPARVLVWGVIGTVSFIVNIYFIGLIVSVIASWVAPASRHPALFLVHQLLEPLMAPIRKLIPPMGGIDISPIFAFLALEVIRIFLHQVYVPKQLVLGI